MKDVVLLVDDEANVLNGLRRALHKQPYELITANSGRAALEIMAQRRVDIVVSDEKMPEMTGSEFLGKARQLYPDTVRLMLTGEATLDAAVRAINEGEIYRFLRKPCEPTELTVAIAQGLQQQKLLINARQLLRKARRQSAILAQLEHERPGITAVRRDDSGAIIIDEDSPKDFNAFVAALNAEVDRENAKEQSG